MAGAACKIIIDHMRTAIADSLHEVVVRERGTRLKEEHADSLLQRLADIDNAAYTGRALPDGGLLGVAKELTDCGIFDKDVWVMLNPGF